MSRFDRSSIIHGALVLFGVAVVAKAAQVQLLQRDKWRPIAERQHFMDASLVAPRGTITDASGRVLVQSRELVMLQFDPRAIHDRKMLARVLTAARVSKEWVRRATDTTRKWVELPNVFSRKDVAPLLDMRGMHTTPVVDRVFSGSAGMRRIVGRVNAKGEPVDGLELALDTLLRGVRGTAQLVKDNRGRALESPFSRGQAARPGHAVTLTINAALQDICERALASAIDSLRATGGDIVVLSPFDGAVLALASQRADPTSTSATTLSEPFEPGSTVKPIVAARLMELGRAKPNEVVNTENGEWAINGRVIHDDEPKKELALRDVIRFSSNIGIAKFAQRLSPREQFELLRDAGFGTPTGVPYPAEAAGRVRPPSLWTPQSPQSLAMGYEFSVTPLQLATAYAAIANGGDLLEPSLVSEVRDADDTVVWKQQRHVVRHLMSARVAADVREMLKSVVDSGTSTQADLAAFDFGGKSGTARRVEKKVGYVAGHYNAVFAGIFPMNAPQYVVVVKIENPQGTIFGGKTAGPVAKTVLQAAYAARDAALNRAKLAKQVLPEARDAYTPKPSPRDTIRVATAIAPIELRRDSVAADSESRGAPRFVVDLPARRTATRPAAPPRAVPAVQGLPLRDAVYALHRAGFHVRLVAGLPAGRTEPSAGAVAPAGAPVTLYRTP